MAFTDKINYLFENKKDVGICVVVGTEELNELGGWWMNAPTKLKGHIIQENNGKDTHLVKGEIGYFNNIVAVDGCIFCVRGKILKEGLKFDTTFKGFHFYEINFCLDMLLKTDYKICVADILIRHKSMGIGSLTKEWFEAKKQMIDKYKNKGLFFPISIESIKKFKETK
jgi:hypothetical protein